MSIWSPVGISSVVIDRENILKRTVSIFKKRIMHSVIRYRELTSFMSCICCEIYQKKFTAFLNSSCVHKYPFSLTLGIRVIFLAVLETGLITSPRPTLGTTFPGYR